MRKFHRAVHFDFHTMPGIHDIGQRFNADKFAQQLSDAHVDYINFFAHIISILNYANNIYVALNVFCHVERSRIFQLSELKPNLFELFKRAYEKSQIVDIYFK